jgi:hypothetical protein
MPFFSQTTCSLILLSTPFLALSIETSQKEAVIIPDNVLTAAFTPPEGWRVADSTSLPKSVRIMVVGKGNHPFPPSINLGTEEYKGSLKEYLRIVKAINDAEGSEWTELGPIQTQAGTASLSQVNTTTEWGAVKMMHVILLKEGTVYILTAAAREEEFTQFYPDFFKAMRSLRITSRPASELANLQ